MGQPPDARAVDPDVQTGRWFTDDGGTPDFPAGFAVTTMEVDSEQQLWIGTDGGGLARYDGFTWTRYTVAGTGGQLLSDEIQVIKALGGTIGIGTRSGVNFFNPSNGQWSGYTTATGLPNNDIRAIATGVLFGYQFGTGGSGIAHCVPIAGPPNTMDCSTETEANSDLPGDFILDLDYAANGDRWIVTPGVVTRVHDPLFPPGDAEWTFFSSQNTPGCPDLSDVHNMTLDREHGRVWFALSEPAFDIGGDASSGTGACVYDMNSDRWRQFHTGNSGLVDNTVLEVAVDTQGRAWFATDHFGPSGPTVGGVSVYTWVTDACCWKTYQSDDSPLADNQVYSAIASEDRVWFGLTPGGLSSLALHWQTWAQETTALASLPGEIWTGTPAGLFSFDGNAFAEELADVNVEDILALAADEIWVATTTGAYRWNGNRWRRFTSANSGLAENHVTALAQDNQGRTWMGTADSGVSVYRRMGNNWATFDTNSTLESNVVYDVAASAGGEVWVATGGGLSRYDGSTWQTFTTADGFPTDTITAVGIDAGGTVWAGTPQGALSWDGAAWTNHAAAMPLLDLMAIYAPPAGGVWFGAQGGALFYDGTNWTAYRARNSGLTHERVAALTGDAEGAVWFGGVQYTEGSLPVAGGLFVRWIDSEPLGDAIPDITEFTPVSGIANTEVTISGSGFEPGSQVYFGANGPGTGQLASVVSVLPDTIIARVPANAVSGPLRVTNGVGPGVSEEVFHPIPQITSIDPAAGVVGAPVKIVGTNLVSGGFPDIKFGDGEYSSIITFGTSPTLVSAYVAEDATTGPVRLRTDSGEATGPIFTVSSGGLKILDWDVHQGLPEYGPVGLISGKSTVVRVFLGSDDPNGACAFVSDAVLQTLADGETTPHGYTVSLADGGIPNDGWFCGTDKQVAAGGSIDFVIPGSDLPPGRYHIGVGFSAGFVDLPSRELGIYGFGATGDMRVHISAPALAYWDNTDIYGPIDAEQRAWSLFNRQLTNLYRIYPVRDGAGAPGTANGLQYYLNPAFQMCNGVDDGFCSKAGDSYDFRYDFWQENISGAQRVCTLRNILPKAQDDGSVIRFTFDLDADGAKRSDFLAYVRPGATLPPDPTTLLSVNTGSSDIAVETVAADTTFSSSCGDFTYGDVIQYQVTVRNNGTEKATGVQIAIDYNEGVLNTAGPGALVLGNGPSIATYNVPGPFFLVDGSQPAKFDPPLDLNANGVIDVDDLSKFVAEFDNWNPSTGEFAVSTDLAQVGPKDIIRNFADENDNLESDDGNFAPFLERTNRVDYAVYDVPRAYMDAYNENSATELQFSQIWFWGRTNPFDFRGLAGQAPGSVSLWADLDGDSTVVHELGHNTGLQHSPTQKIPFVPYGYNVLERRVILAEELLSSMGDPVIGPIENVLFTPAQYFHVWDVFRALAPDQQVMAAQGGPLFHIAGILARNGQIEVSGSYVTAGLPVTPDDIGGAYRLRFVEGSQMLAEHPFAVSFEIDHLPEGEETPPDQAAFALTYPAPANTDGVEIWQGATRLLRLDVSAMAPVVAIQTPGGGESIAADGMLSIHWTGSDVDGDTLTYAVYYSADNGATWAALTPATTATALTVPAANLPGGASALVEVRASDGYHTATARSAAFQVGGKGPQWAAILAPDAGESWVQSQLLTLVGAGYDLEDGPLTGSRLEWRSDRDGRLGVGETVTATLTAGIHWITLTVNDSANLTATDSISVEVLSDFDDDGLADVYEQGQSVLAWWNPQDAGQDPDGDGLTSRSEASFGTDPGDADSDGDGVEDGAEAAAGSLPLDANSTPQPAELLASQSALDFAMPQGGPNPAARQILLSSSTPEALSWSASSLPTWLRLDVSSGQTPTVVTISVAGEKLGAGVHQGEAIFSGQGSTWTVEVSLTVVGENLFLPAMAR
jgi:hypothetical protein